MSADFQRALAFVLEVEGGYTNDPVDRGGATNKGILQRVYDIYRKAEGLRSADVRHILNIEVEEIYRDAYWLEGDCDRMPWPVSLVHFDACVNTGVTQAASSCSDRWVRTPTAGSARKHWRRCVRCWSVKRPLQWPNGW
jgi:lysozyme family protein